MCIPLEVMRAMADVTLCCHREYVQADPRLCFLVSHSSHVCSSTAQQMASCHSVVMPLFCSTLCLLRSECSCSVSHQMSTILDCCAMALFLLVRFFTIGQGALSCFAGCVCRSRGRCRALLKRASGYDGRSRAYNAISCCGPNGLAGFQ
jgi:hypothetical protein